MKTTAFTNVIHCQDVKHRTTKPNGWIYFYGTFRLYNNFKVIAIFKEKNESICSCGRSMKIHNWCGFDYYRCDCGNTKPLKERDTNQLIQQWKQH